MRGDKIEENKVKFFRINVLTKTQQEMADLLKMSRQSYNYKENKHIQFNDSEKIKFRNELQKYIPDIKADDIFF